MKISISRLQQNFWAWFCLSIFNCLWLELLIFAIAGLIFHKSINDLRAPFLTFAILWLIMLPTVWWLREWERRGASIKKLTHGWAISMSLFLILAQIAFFYSASKLRLISNLDWGGVYFAMFCGIVVVYIAALFYVPLVITNRAAKK